MSSTRHGARLARLLAVTELHAWGLTPDITERAELVVAELAANAVPHGRVPGRDFELALTYTPLPRPGRLLIEVSDARGDRLPRAATDEPDLSTGGRGMTLLTLLRRPLGDRPTPTGRQDRTGGTGHIVRYLTVR
ncbi:ATP-binding protein [Streptomyces sp. NPDC048172]|uniref:ATP-binding protein n=1 Tax=Streptomyces sp. NPDC048172 TaxID=3365505 RepID=UPI003720D714